MTTPAILPEEGAATERGVRFDHGESTVLVRSGLTASLNAPQLHVQIRGPVRLSDRHGSFIYEGTLEDLKTRLELAERTMDAVRHARRYLEARGG